MGSGSGEREAGGLLHPCGPCGHDVVDPERAGSIKVPRAGWGDCCSLAIKRGGDSCRCGGGRCS